MKVGIIGAGAISTRHIESYMKCADVEVAAIADLNEATAKMQVQKYQIPQYYTDYHKILEDETIDAASIMTPAFTRANRERISVVGQACIV